MIAVFQRRLHADDDSFLADIEVTKAADQTHAIELAGTLFEAADQQHVAIVLKQFVLARFRAVLLAVALGHQSSSSAVTR